jgi:hypothetical protein
MAPAGAIPRHYSLPAQFGTRHPRSTHTPVPTSGSWVRRAAKRPTGVDGPRRRSSNTLDLRPHTNTSNAACARPVCNPPAATATASSSAQNFLNRLTHPPLLMSQLNSSQRRSEPHPRQLRIAGEWTGTDSNACLSVRDVTVVRH